MGRGSGILVDEWEEGSGDLQDVHGRFIALEE
jgi:hypothetical protein